MTKVMTQVACVLALAASFLACSSPNTGDEPSDPETGGSGGSDVTGGMGGTSGDAGEGGTSATGGGGAGAMGGGGMNGTGGSSGAAGAGGADTGGAGGTGAGTGGAGGSGGASDTRLFVPDIPNTYDGTIVEPGVELIAHTLREGLLGPEWLVAVENTGTDFLCSLDIESRFYDASNNEIASGSRTLVEVPLARGSSGSGGLVQCLGPGEIGMAVDRLALSNLDDTSVIASVKHSFGALILTDAAFTDDIVVTGVRVVSDASGRNQFTGQIRNDSDVTVRNPSISVFGVNAVGRPLLEAFDIETTTISAGGSWTFTTGSFEESVVDYVAFPDVSD